MKHGEIMAMHMQADDNHEQIFGKLLKQRRKIKEQIEQLYATQLSLRGIDVTEELLDEEYEYLFQALRYDTKGTTRALLTKEFVLEHMYWYQIENEIEDGQQCSRRS